MQQKVLKQQKKRTRDVVFLNNSLKMEPSKNLGVGGGPDLVRYVCNQNPKKKNSSKWRRDFDWTTENIVVVVVVVLGNDSKSALSIKRRDVTRPGFLPHHRSLICINFFTDPMKEKAKKTAEGHRPCRKFTWFLSLFFIFGFYFHCFFLAF